MKMDGGESKEALKIRSLPSQESLSPFLCNLLNQSFNSVDDLAAAPSLLARLQSELDSDNEKFRKVQSRVVETTARGVSHYEVLTGSLRQLAQEIDHIRASSVPLSSVRNELGGDEGGGWEGLDGLKIDGIMSPKIASNASNGLGKNRKSMVEELEALASEVAKVERMRTYAESVLKLEQLVGDLEASIAMISSSGRPSAQIGSSTASLRITRAIHRMQSTENAVAEIARAKWSSLVSAVDLRVDRVAAILRPAAIADHRGVLVSIGWPPPLSAASAGGDKVANPLLDMDEDQELRYGQSFMALATLQAVQLGRKERQLSESNMPAQDGPSPSGSELPNQNGNRAQRGKRSHRVSLWVVEELSSNLI